MTAQGSISSASFFFAVTAARELSRRSVPLHQAAKASADAFGFAAYAGTVEKLAGIAERACATARATLELEAREREIERANHPQRIHIHAPTAQPAEVLV